MKTRPPEDPAEIYSIGMERVAYVLGASLGLPMPTVWLEDFEDAPAAVVERLPEQRQWNQAAGSPMLMKNILNRELWPLCAVFDVWLCNLDRRAANLLIVPDPPGTRPSIARAAKLFLIDHGYCGLWPPQKFDRSLAGSDVEQITVGDGEMDPAMEQWSRDQMPAPYRDSFRAIDLDARNPMLDRVRDIGDHEIEQAVEQVPHTYMSEPAAEKTIELLKVRRDRLEDLTRAHW